jgi:hypothetical protein
MPLGASGVRLGLTAPMGKRGQSGRRYPVRSNLVSDTKIFSIMVRYGGWMDGYVGGVDATGGRLVLPRPARFGQRD